MEGDPLLMDLRSSWLCIATSNGFLRIYDLSRRWVYSIKYVQRHSHIHIYTIIISRKFRSNAYIIRLRSRENYSRNFTVSYWKFFRNRITGKNFQKILSSTFKKKVQIVYNYESSEVNYFHCLQTDRETMLLKKEKKQGSGYCMNRKKDNHITCMNWDFFFFREAKQQYQSKYVVESIDNFNRFVMVKMNKDGNRVSFTCTTDDSKEVCSLCALILVFEQIEWYSWGYIANEIKIFWFPKLKNWWVKGDKIGILSMSNLLIIERVSCDMFWTS